MRRFFVRVLFLSAFSGLGAGAQQAAPATAAAKPVLIPHPQAPTATAVNRSGPVSIDGRLDEAAWQAAKPITDFIQLDPNEGQPASERTEARILIDDDAVYIGMRLFDSEPAQIQSQLARRDESIEGDLVEVSLDSYHDHLSARDLPALSGRCATRCDDEPKRQPGQRRGMPCGKEARRIDSLGWTAEFRIPLSQLRYNRNLDGPGRGDFSSHVRSRAKAEIDLFLFHSKDRAEGINRYGHLTGLGDLPSTRHVELVPYVLAKNQNPSVARERPVPREEPYRAGRGARPEVRNHEQFHARCDVQSRLRSGGSRSGGREPLSVRDFFPRAQAVLRRGLEHFQLRQHADEQFIQRLHVLPLSPDRS